MLMTHPAVRGVTLVYDIAMDVYRDVDVVRREYSLVLPLRKTHDNDMNNS